MGVPEMATHPERILSPPLRETIRPSFHLREQASQQTAGPYLNTNEYAETCLTARDERIEVR
jgi:hypothetical protein